MKAGAGSHVDDISTKAGWMAWMRRPELRRLVTLLFVGTIALILLHMTPLSALLGNVQELRDFLDGDDFWAEVLYLLAVVFFVSIGAPRLVFYSLGGVAFGFWEGLLLAQIGTLLGSLITFQTVRWGGKEWVVGRFGESRSFRRVFQRAETIEAVALIRQLPITSVVINIGLALGHVTVPRFLIGSFIGYLPQGVVATLIGGGLADDEFADGLGQILAAGLITVAVAFVMWRRSQRKIVSTEPL
ncbi:MAG: DedA family protein [Puniceicoccaceae bacterium]|nr:MAG: DedA family protein [Puniceicoccaceae bacterium]